MDDWRDCVRINGLLISEDRLQYVIERGFWKHTVDLNLNTPDGCKEAAKYVVGMLSEFGEGGVVPLGALPESVLLREGT